MHDGPCAPDIDGGEEEQPHHVNEVPVPGGRFETEVIDGEVYVGDTLTWPGKEKVLAKRQALIDAYKAQAKAREEEEARKRAAGETNG